MAASTNKDRIVFKAHSSSPRHTPANMLSRTALRASTATSQVARRGFHSTRAQMGSPYHYPEGPRSNIPFNPLTKFFYVRYWAFMATGFGLPFGVAYWQLHKNKA